MNTVEERLRAAAQAAASTVAPGSKLIVVAHKPGASTISHRTADYPIEIGVLVATSSPRCPAHRLLAPATAGLSSNDSVRRPRSATNRVAWRIYYIGTRTAEAG